MFKFGHLYSTLGSRAARIWEPEDNPGWAHTEEFVVCAALRMEENMAKDDRNQSQVLGFG